MPAAVSRFMATLVDVLRVAFFGAATVLTWQMMDKLGSYKMTIIDLPMNLVYGVCMAGFAAMCLRSLWVMVVHWRRGFSVLERPESTMQDRD
jgi:TRAP-type C4-dicarboxylate transport system permease small subunit